MSNLKSIGDIKKDDITQTIQVMEYAHHEIHDESAFIAHHRFPLVGSGAYAKMYFKSPASGPKCHTVASFSVEGQSEVEIREGATVSLSGTALTAYNRLRKSTVTSGVAARHTPTITASGTRLEAAQYGGGDGPRSFGGEGGSNQWVLLSGTVYLFRVISEAASNDIIIDINWDEIEPLQ